MTASSATLRKMHQRRKRRRQLALQRVALWSFVAFEVVVGGASGVLLAALLLGEKHPIYQAIREWLVRWF